MLWSLTDDQWHGAYELLIGGPIRLLRELAPLFVRRLVDRVDRVVVVASADPGPRRVEHRSARASQRS